MNVKKFTLKYYTNIYSNRKVIYKENKNKTGIYFFRNITNNKIYIGSALNLTARLYSYLSYSYLKWALLKSNSAIYKAILKYGYNNFEFGILIYCKKNELIKQEQFFIDLLKPEYNILKHAYFTSGFKHSEITLLKLRKYKPTVSTLAKLRLAKELSGTTLIIINKKNNIINKFESLRSAARYLNVSHTGLRYCIKKKILLKKTYLLIPLIKFNY